MSKEAKEFIKNNHPNPDQLVIEKNLLHNVAIIMQAYADESRKVLINDYERRLKTAMQMIKEGGNDIQLTRLGTKASCYRTIIEQLKQLEK